MNDVLPLPYFVESRSQPFQNGWMAYYAGCSSRNNQYMLQWAASEWLQGWQYAQAYDHDA